MKVYTSYFYQIRFFKPNMIPISTALRDPKWYHQNQNQEHWFIDKNGVINGLRAPVFAPGLAATAVSSCGSSCPKDFENCDFLKAYSHQLSLLDINDIMTRTEKICAKAQKVLGFKEEPIAIFIVHEAPDNPCSERTAIQNYFHSHGIECEEWRSSEVATRGAANA